MLSIELKHVNQLRDEVSFIAKRRFSIKEIMKFIFYSIMLVEYHDL